jgi:hypothetical protein
LLPKTLTLAHPMAHPSSTAATAVATGKFPSSLEWVATR